MMALEADRMANHSLKPNDVDSEREVILEERLSRTDNDPAAQFAEQIAAATYLAYPYRIPVIGWGNEMPGLGHDDAVAFSRTWSAPNNAVLAGARAVHLGEGRGVAVGDSGEHPA